METSREIVRQTLEFAGPARLAHSFAPSDLVYGHPQIPNPLSEWRKINDREWRRVDEWGNEWARVDDTSLGEVRKGALEDLARVESFPLPSFSDPAYFAEAKDLFEAHPDKWHIGSIGGFTFGVAREIRRLDQYLQDLLLDRDRIRILHDRVDAAIVEEIDGMRDAGADCIMIAEDWGTQLRLMISPQLWREEYRPRFRHLCHHAHSLDLKVFMHSCGKIGDIVPDLIETGIDVFHFDQPLIHGIDVLRYWRDDLNATFWCPVDIQVSLQSRDEEVIRQAAHDLVDNLWRGEGGLIAGFYTDNASIGLEPKWQDIAIEGFLEQSLNWAARATASELIAG